jgi:hypothetical protein
MMKSEKHVCLAQQNGFGLAILHSVLSADKRHSTMEYKKSHIPDFDSRTGPNWPKMSKNYYNFETQMSRIIRTLGQNTKTYSYK